MERKCQNQELPRKICLAIQAVKNFSILQTKHSKVNSSYQKAKKLTHNNKDNEIAKEILNEDIEPHLQHSQLNLRIQ